MTNLTEQWKKCELPLGMYYVKMPLGVEILSDYSLYRYKLTRDVDSIEVLAPVPSYEEWQGIKVLKETRGKCLLILQDENEGLNEENKKLKELLKECVEVLNDAQRNYGYDDSIIDICSPIITKIDNAIGDSDGKK